MSTKGEGKKRETITGIKTLYGRGTAFLCMLTNKEIKENKRLKGEFIKGG